MKYSFLLVLMLSSMNLFALSPQSQDHTITIFATGTVEVEADFIDFQITINQFHKEAGEAFNKHKEQESFLADLLKEENFTDKDITVTPISISSSVRQPDEHGYRTRQQVSVRVSDLDLFEQMQLIFIENGFTNFSGTLGTLQQKTTGEEALKKAMEAADEKARILAESSDVQITGISSVEYNAEQIVSTRQMDRSYAMESSNSMLQQFKQTVSVQERVKVVYTFE